MIKICGLTRRVDAETAARHGATAIGFNFWPKSPRFVVPEMAAEIVKGLSEDITTVGVFVDEAPDVMRSVADRVGLGAIQLHGGEPADYGEALGRPVLKAFGVGSLEQMRAWPSETLILLDAVDSPARGGTGMRVDWTQAARVARERRVVLAGGLTPDNVAEAIATVRPFGVDVASGVERSPGIKDEDKVRRFVTEARDAFARLGRDRT
ncbi:MAG: phosphoribosylanthranilate isomerase [Vicinamibacterales bacterium]